MSQQMQQLNQMKYEMEMQRALYANMGYKAPKRPQNEEEEEAQEEEPAEEDKKEVDDDIKDKMKNIFMDEMMRRYILSGTFELQNGTIVPKMRYTEDDPVVQFYKNEKGQDLVADDDLKWDVEKDAEFLYHAMEGLGTDDEVVIHIVSTRSNAQRQELRKFFKSAYGEDLIDHIKSELSGNYRKAIRACFEPPAIFDAKCIKEAIYGLGTDEQALIEILLTRTNAQIQEIRQVYGKVARPDEVTYDTEIEADIEGDCSGDFKKLLIAASQGSRSEISREQLEEAVEEIQNAAGEGTGMFQINYERLTNANKAKRDAKELYEKGEGKFFGTDERCFIRVFSTRNPYELKHVYSEYVKLQQCTMHHAIDEETSGDLKKGLQTIYEVIYNRPKYFANRLVKSMKGLGTDEQTLIRIVVSRAEIDMVQIKQEFLNMTQKSLWRWIKEDTSFNFKEILCALVGRD